MQSKVLNSDQASGCCLQHSCPQVGSRSAEVLAHPARHPCHATHVKGRTRGTITTGRALTRQKLPKLRWMTPRHAPAGSRVSGALGLRHSPSARPAPRALPVRVPPAGAQNTHPASSPESTSQRTVSCTISGHVAGRLIVPPSEPTEPEHLKPDRCSASGEHAR